MTQASDLTAGQALYLQQCGTCHGQMGSGATGLLTLPSAWRVAAVQPFRAALNSIAGQMLPARRIFQGHSVLDGDRVAVAPPFGPSLRGVVGRPAGSVKGFSYSRAFMTVLQGMVWNRHTLDVWLTDTQAWVPRSRMFYKQPDAEIRHKIISYLEANP